MERKWGAKEVVSTCKEKEYESNRIKDREGRQRYGKYMGGGGGDKNMCVNKLGKWRKSNKT
jgi:hypothetical protein